MTIRFTAKAEEDLAHWKKTDPKKVVRIKALLADIEKNPRAGIGKPKQLTGNMSGLMSRRIDQTNRLVYHMQGDVVTVLSCRFHYSD